MDWHGNSGALPLPSHERTGKSFEQTKKTDGSEKPPSVNWKNDPQGNGGPARDWRGEKSPCYHKG